MTDLARLVVEYDTSDVGRGVTAFDRATDAGARLERKTNDVSASAQLLGRNFDNLISALAANTNATTSLVRQQGELAQASNASAAAARQAAEAQRQQAQAEREAQSQAAALESKLHALRGAVDPLYSAQRQLNNSLADAAELYQRGAINFAEYERSVVSLQGKLNALNSTEEKVVAAHGRATNSSKALSGATLNLTRQFSDVAVSAAGGINPFMILIQQGPQIADGFAVAKMQGLGFSAVLKGMAAEAAPLLVALAPLAGVAAAGALAFGLMNRELSKKYPKDVTDGLHLTEEQLKRVKDKTVTMGDTFHATLDVMGKYLTQGPVGDALDWLKAKFNSFADGAASALFDMTVNVVGTLVGGFRTIEQNWHNLPAVAKDVAVMAANATIEAVQMAVNGTVKALNLLIKGASIFPGFQAWRGLEIPEADLSKFKMQTSGAFEFVAKSAKVNIDQAKTDVAAGLNKMGDEISKGAIKRATDRALKQAGDAAKDSSKKAGKSEAEKQYERDVKASKEYIEALKKETAEISLNDIERKQWEVNAAAAKAPTAALKEEILKLGDAWVKAKRGWDEGVKLSGAITQLQDYIDGLEFEQSTLGKTAEEQARLTALHNIAKLELGDNAEAVKGLTDRYIQLATQNGAMQDKVTAAQDLLDVLSEVDRETQNAANGMAAAFGNVGKAIGDLTTTFTGYAVTRQQIEADLAEKQLKYGADSVKGKQAELDAAKKLRNAQIDYYGDMAAAAKGMFKEHTAGYELASAAEKAFRLYEFAMSAKSVATKAAETAAKVGLFGAQAQAAAQAGAANMFATLGPAGFAAVAAMVAVLAGLGMSSVGGGGGAAPGAADAENRQKAQGAGSVLGDVTAKSQSITNAIEEATKATNKDLEYSSDMVRYLKSIDSQIGTVAGAIARILAAGGQLDTAKLNLGTAVSGPSGLTKLLNPLSWIAPALFGKTTTTTLQDQGLSFDAQSLSQILSNGINGQTYQQTLTNTKKKFFGITYSDKNSQNTTTQGIEGDLAQQLTLLVGSLRDGVLSAANALGIEGAKATLDAFTVNIGKISFKDMSGDEIQSAINGVFSKLGDQMAEAIYGSLSSFQKVGEGAFETLVRIAREYQVVDTTLKSIGMTFNGLGVASLAARDRLVQLFGDVETFADATAQFADNFLTDAERIAPVQAAVSAEMARLGLATVTTKDQFKQLVLGLDVSTESGAEMYAALMNVAPAFAKVADYASKAHDELINTLSDNVKTARDELTQAYNREASALQDTISKFNNFAESLRKFRQTLSTGPAAALSPEEQYKATRAAFESTAARARLGDPTALQDLQGLSQEYLDASKDYYATTESYFRDLEYVRSAVEAAEKTAQRTADNATQQLDALKQSVSQLISLNDNVVSVRKAIDNLNAAVIALAMAKNPNDPKASWGLPGTDQYNVSELASHGQTAGANDAFNAAAYLAQNPDIGEYAATHGLDAASFAQQHYTGTGQFEVALGLRERGFAKGGAFTNGIVKKPTAFNMAVMGEGNRPEGILPLANVNGRLGVHAVGTGSDEKLAAVMADVRDELQAARVQREAATKMQVGAIETLSNEIDALKRRIAER